MTNRLFAAMPLSPSLARRWEAVLAQERAALAARMIEESVGDWKRHPGDKLGLIGRDGAAWALLIVAAEHEGVACEECGRPSLLLLTRPLEQKLCWWCWREHEGD